MEIDNLLKIVGWKEWELDGDLKITSSRGWFDAEEYDRQVKGLRERSCAAAHQVRSIIFDQMLRAGSLQRVTRPMNSALINAA